MPKETEEEETVRADFVVDDVVVEVRRQDRIKSYLILLLLID